MERTEVSTHVDPVVFPDDPCVAYAGSVEDYLRDAVHQAVLSQLPPPPDDMIACTR